MIDLKMHKLVYDHIKKFAEVKGITILDSEAEDLAGQIDTKYNTKYHYLEKAFEVAWGQWKLHIEDHEQDLLSNIKTEEAEYCREVKALADGKPLYTCKNCQHFESKRMRCKWVGVFTSPESSCKDYSKITTQKTCAECDGHGVIRHPKVFAAITVCPTCNGTGKLIKGA